MGQSSMNDFIRALSGYKPVVKPKLFVSYHHGNDQAYYDLFCRTFCDSYDVFTDNSLDHEIDSTDTDYVMRVIREQFVTGSSVTVVLCGTETWKRKYVDWEIKATLDKQHALLGIILPTNPYNWVPERLKDNLDSGYAYLMVWPQNAQALASGIQLAKTRAQQTWLINNSRAMMGRNLS